MNMRRSLGGICGISVCCWVRHSLRFCPWCAEAPREPDHFPQSERVAIASPNGGKQCQKRAPGFCKANASASTHIEVTDPTRLVMVIPLYVAWLTDWEVAKISRRVAHLITAMTDLQAGQRSDGHTVGYEVAEIRVHAATICSDSHDLLRYEKQVRALYI